MNIAGFASQLQDDGSDLRPAGGSDWMALGKQTTVHIYRNAAFLVGFFTLNQIFSFTRLGKSQVFISHHFRNGKTIVHLGDINVPGGDTCHLIGLPAGLPGHGQACKYIASRQIDTGARCPQTLDPDRFLAQCFGLFFAGDDDTGTAVGIGAAVAYPQGAGDRAGHAIFRIGKHVKSNRFAVNSPVIELSVGGRLDPDQGQIIRTRAVFLHVGPGIHGIVSRHHRAEGAFPLNVGAASHSFLGL